MLAAIFGFENAALLIWTIRMPERSDVNVLGIRGINQDSRNMARIFQADVSPSFSTVVRAVHAVAFLDIGSHIGFPGADVNHAFVRWRDGDGANRRHAYAVENRHPSAAIVFRFPHPTTDGAKEERIRIGANSAHGQG